MRVRCYQNVILYDKNKRADAYQTEWQEYEGCSLLNIIDNSIGYNTSNIKSIEINKRTSTFIINFYKYNDEMVQIRGEILNE